MWTERKGVYTVFNPDGETQITWARPFDQSNHVKSPDLIRAVNVERMPFHIHACGINLQACRSTPVASFSLCDLRLFVIKRIGHLRKSGFA